jgi:CRP-like cAMP-binding protein
METLRKHLNEECDYRLSDETVARFFGLMSEVYLKNNEPLISYGQMDYNLYIVREGLLRHTYFDGSMEKTFGFSTPGTIIMSYHSTCMNKPSVFQLESCGDSVIMRVAKADFEKLLKESRDFTNWMYRMSIFQLYAWEMKSTLINGTAKERFEALVKNRPEIIDKVSLKVIASYIGITQQSLSRLKRQFMPDFRK